MIKVRINSLPSKKVAIEEILIQPGDYIDENQAIALIKYQNKTIPIISPTSGQIKKVYLKLNKKLKIGKKIIKIDETKIKNNSTSIFSNKWIKVDDENFDTNNIETIKNNVVDQKSQINLDTTKITKSGNPQIDQKIKDLQEKVGGVSKYRQKINEKINNISSTKSESETKTNDEKQLTFRKIINQRVDEVKKNNNTDYTSEKQVNKMEKNDSKLNENQLIKRKDIPVGEPRPMSYAERIFARAEAFEKAKTNNKNLVLSGKILNRMNALSTDENPDLNSIVSNLTNNNDLNNDFTNNNLNNEQYMQNSSILTNQQMPIEQNVQTINNNLPNLNNFVQLPQNQNLMQQQMYQQLLNLQNQQLLTNPLLMQLYPQFFAQQQMQQQLLLNQMLNFNPMLNNLYLWNLPNISQLPLPNLNNLSHQLPQTQSNQQQSQIYQVKQDNASDANLQNILNQLNNQNKNLHLSGQKKSNSNPIVTSLTNEVDLTSILKLRERLIATGGKEYARLNYIIFIIKAVSSALKQYPQLNAIYDQESGQTIIKNYHNISLTTTTGEGIKNPVINSVNQLSIKQLSHNLENILMRVKTKQADFSYFEGSTISITNFGSHRVVSGVAPIQDNHVAAISIGKVEKRPVVLGDKLVIRHLCHISITINQRSIDNSLAGNFLGTLKESLEKPDIITFAG